MQQQYHCDGNPKCISFELVSEWVKCRFIQPRTLCRQCTYVYSIYFDNGRSMDTGCRIYSWEKRNARQSDPVEELKCSRKHSDREIWGREMQWKVNRSLDWRVNTGMTNKGEKVRENERKGTVKALACTHKANNLPLFQPFRFTLLNSPFSTHPPLSSANYRVRREYC